ncbi:MAG: Rrf2 family transcriptional regulator [Candidatus Omnitrophica bacterium]|nr:Rrf2 family transcriptional regulator [Candidatus Omnitrophota bacterium]MCM8770569.1 Rrf2 family transcriptional regulator [Candidatus Omnitrophota bacterium]
MQISYKGDYALKAVLDLALHYGQGVVSIHDMAKRLDIPFKFLEQVLLELKQAGFVDSKRGIKGGYFLANPPRQITIGSVVRFIDGPLEPIACANLKTNYKGCRDINTCLLRGIWIEVTQAISDIIDKITFQDICDKIRAAKGDLVYQI